MIPLLFIDNYDSFTYNLVHYFEGLNCRVTVVQNDEITAEMIEKFDRIVLSPGPGLPSEAGNLSKVLKQATHKNILGICLGHQALGELMGAKLKNLTTVFHGVSTPINIDNQDILFKNLPSTIAVGRYHSWVIDPENLPPDLQITATDFEGNIMAFRHQKLAIYGVQFHPESILTPLGKNILKNWLSV